MKFSSCFGIILALACLQSAVAQKNLDTIWICHDSIKVASAYDLFFKMYLSDTFPDNRGPFEPVDTGERCDGSRYVNFDYQFTTEKPGYAGFKFYWDNGSSSFYASKHDSMFLWHKGPLPGHKVKIVWGQGGACGEPINLQTFAEFKSSATWKRESFAYPAGFVADGIFEMRMLIYNDDGTTSPTSAPGCLKLDNIGFIKKNASSVHSPKHTVAGVANPRFFVPTVSGNVTLTVYSLQGEQLFKGVVEVTAGKRYDVGQFALNNSNLLTGMIQCVQVSGSGVNITTKVNH